MAALRTVSSGSRGAYHRVDDSGRGLERGEAHGQLWQKSNCSCDSPAPRRRRRCSPGTTASGATCPGGRAPGASPTPTASGCPRSCCSRRRSRRSSPTTSAFLARWPTVEALAGGDARRRARGLGGAWLLQPRAQSAQVRRASSPSELGGPFPGHGRRPARAAGHRPLHGGGHRRHRLRRARTTPVDGNIERVVARLFAVKTAAAGGQARDQAARRAR